MFIQWKKYIAKLLPEILIVGMTPYLISRSLNADWFLYQNHVQKSGLPGEGSSQQMEYECIMKLACAMPLHYQKEALKAQAVLIRTNLLYEINNGEKERDVLPKELMMVEKPEILYKKYSYLKEIVGETTGKVLTFEGNIVHLPYCRLSAGNTRENEKEPYLTSVESSWDMTSGEYLDLTMFSWEKFRDLFCQNLYLYSLMEKKDTATPSTIDFPMEEEESILPYDDSLSLQKNFEASVEIIERETTGYVKTVRVGEYQIPGEVFKDIYGLKSSNFYIDIISEKNPGNEKKSESIRIVTRGNGHGYGMSQYGAEYLAKEGKTAEEILKTYFPKLELSE